jgi:hypothetical protein
MKDFHKRFSHNQIRAVFVVLGLLLVGSGSGLIYAYLYKKICQLWSLLTGIGVVAVGCLIITLELTGLRRVIAIGFGFVILAAGLVLMVPGMPGPGIPVAIVGLAILASEFKWAENLYNRLVEFSRRATEKLRRKKTETVRENDASQPPR